MKINLRALIGTCLVGCLLVMWFSYYQASEPPTEIESDVVNKKLNNTSVLQMNAYLLVYFKDEDHSLHMALSTDGYSFTNINDGKPVIAGENIAEQKGIRDPHIYRGPDGVFYLAMTDLHIFAQKYGFRDTKWQRPEKNYGWGNNRGFVLMKSNDLINWSAAKVRLDKEFSGFDEIGCAWAPQTIYDPIKNKLMLYYTMRFKNNRNRMYYSYVNNNFDGLETAPKLLFEYPKKVSYIDADITKVGDKFHLFYTPHDGVPGIKQAVSTDIHSNYVYDDTWYDAESVASEAPNVWQRIGQDKWVLMYDIYGVEPHNSWRGNSFNACRG
ncbi:MAG: glycoside hydrolase family 43 protein [Colwellia sp.]